MEIEFGSTSIQPQKYFFLLINKLIRSFTYKNKKIDKIRFVIYNYYITAPSKSKDLWIYLLFYPKLKSNYRKGVNIEVNTCSCFLLSNSGNYYKTDQLFYELYLVVLWYMTLPPMPHTVRSLLLFTTPPPSHRLSAICQYINTLLDHCSLVVFRGRRKKNILYEM